MTQNSLDLMRRAEREGAVDAPPPRYDPSEAGLVGASICCMAILVFTAVARLDIDAFPEAFGVTVITGFLLPFLHFRHLREKNRAAVYRRYDSLLNIEPKKPLTSQPPSDAATDCQVTAPFGTRTWFEQVDSKRERNRDIPGSSGASQSPQAAPDTAE